jgi:uncharacterized protein YydD (DUF2326 family)
LILVKRIEDVASFHESLLEKRNKRLRKEKLQLEEKQKKLEELQKGFSQQINKNLKFLGEHGALDQFIALNSKLSEIKTEVDKLQTYKGILQEYKNKLEQIKIEFSQENISTNNYLSSLQGQIDKKIELYRSFSKEFYEDRPGGIEVINNDGINQIRYNINVRLEDDTSDGINEVKIFCYDLTILVGGNNHKMNFIFHDSRLFSNMDPRQLATLFRVAFEQTSNKKYQYICSINENMVTPLIETYGDDEYKKIITDNFILELTDKSAESKLLGIQLDLEYDKDS